LVICQQQQKIQ